MYNFTDFCPRVMIFFNFPVSLGLGFKILNFSNLGFLGLEKITLGSGQVFGFGQTRPITSIHTYTKRGKEKGTSSSSPKNRGFFMGKCRAFISLSKSFWMIIDLNNKNQFSLFKIKGHFFSKRTDVLSPNNLGNSTPF